MMTTTETTIGLTEADRAFVAEVEECRRPTLSHLDHVRLAWVLLVETSDLEAALARLGPALRRFARSKGHPEKFDEALTRRWTEAIAGRIAASGAVARWDGFVAANADLFSRSSVSATRQGTS